VYVYFYFIFENNDNETDEFIIMGKVRLRFGG